MILKQSTAATVVVGPVLDSSGAAVTTAVTANFSLSKNGTVNALTSETVTHSTNGYYTIALTSSNTDTLGRIEIIVNDSAMSMATHRYNVIVGTSYDLLVTSGGYSTLDASGIRTAVGLASANLDTQLSTIDTVVDNIETDTQDIQSRLPAALVDGRMDVYVGAMGIDTITSASLSTEATTEIADRVAGLDILTSPYGTSTWARVARDTYLNLAVVDVIVDQILADTADMQPKVATAQEIGDAFLSHVITKGDPGTIERAFWQVTKAAASFDGTVQTSVSNTASSFLTDIAIDDFAGQVLVLVDGALAGEARAITSVVSGVVTVHDAFTGVPADGVNFLVLPQQVYSISQIQNGLATSAGVTSAFTEIKGATWSSSTDTLEAIRDASGGSSSITITAGAANAPARSDDTNLIAFVDETISQALAIYEADGTTAKDMSGKTLTVVFENLETTDTAVVANGDITVSGDDSNTVTWAYPAAVTSTVGTYRYALRDAAAPKTVYAQGLLFVKVAAAVD